jgi:hypothetical protein
LSLCNEKHQTSPEKLTMALKMVVKEQNDFCKKPSLKFKKSFVSRDKLVDHLEAGFVSSEIVAEPHVGADIPSGGETWFLLAWLMKI